MPHSTSTRRFQRLSAITVSVLLSLAAPMAARAQTQAPEADLKAAIISNMLLFVEWPAAKSAPDEPLVICYQEPGPVANALVKLDGKTMKGRALKVVQLAGGNAGICHALYLSPDNAGGLGKIISVIGNSPVFVAADSPEYAKRGIMLNLDVAGGRVVFDIDLRSAQKSGLQISSKALRLARQVFE